MPSSATGGKPWRAVRAPRPRGRRDGHRARERCGLTVRCYSDGVLPFVWDYDIDELRFRDLLEGRTTIGTLDRDWAAVRLLDYAPWSEIRRLMTLGDLVRGWPRWRARVRSVSRRRGLDFLAEWLPRHHPELL